MSLKENPQADHPEIANIEALFTDILGRTGTNAASPQLTAEIKAAQLLLTQLAADRTRGVNVGTTGKDFARTLKEIRDVEIHGDLNPTDRRNLTTLIRQLRVRYEWKEVMSGLKKFALTVGAIVGIGAAGAGTAYELHSEGIRGRDTEGANNTSLLQSLTATTNIATQDPALSFEYLWTELRKDAENWRKQTRVADTVEIDEKNDVDTFKIVTDMDLSGDTRTITFKAISGKSGKPSENTLKRTRKGDVVANQNGGPFVRISAEDLEKIVKSYALY